MMFINHIRFRGADDDDGGVISNPYASYFISIEKNVLVQK